MTVDETPLARLRAASFVALRRSGRVTLGATRLLAFAGRKWRLRRIYGAAPAQEAVHHFIYHGLHKGRPYQRATDQPAQQLERNPIKLHCTR